MINKQLQKYWVGSEESAHFYYNSMAEENKNKPPQAQNQINIELSEEIAEGIYSNLAMIAHSNSEFVIDFIRLMPGVPKAKVKSRIVITPEHAKRFCLL